MLPAMVQIIIMMVNGNIGAGVAVAGAFGLIRFRSAPGSAREIGMVFLTTAIGLATGMGYVIVAAAFFIIIAVFSILLTLVGFGAGEADERELKITIPENLDYDGLFDDLLNKYTRYAELERVKTTSMGTLYELSYKVVLRDQQKSKEFLDELRTRNGNLSIGLRKACDEGGAVKPLVKLDPLLKSTKPSYAVITSSDDEPESEEVVRALKQAGIRILLTREGSVTLESDGTEVRLANYSGLSAASRMV